METATFKRFAVPLDILTDIVKVILEMELKNEITAVNENKAFIEIKVEYQNGLGFHQKAPGRLRTANYKLRQRPASNVAFCRLYAKTKATKLLVSTRASLLQGKRASSYRRIQLGVFVDCP
jgi:hypothetical protein